MKWRAEGGLFPWDEGSGVGAATPGLDFEAVAPGTLSVPAGTITADFVVRVNILRDDLLEYRETFELQLYDAASSFISIPTAHGVISDSTPAVDLDNDSNNDGTINASDDAGENTAPSARIVVNTDDDNDNGIPDGGDTGPVSGEDDLEPFKLWHADSGYHDVPDFDGWKLVLKITSGEGKVWEDANKGTPVVFTNTQEVGVAKIWTIGTDQIPSTLYLEKLAGGSTGLSLNLHRPDWNGMTPDCVLFTSYGLSIDGRNVMALNNDDDDLNGVLDVDDASAQDDDDLEVIAIHADNLPAAANGMITVSASGGLLLWRDMAKSELFPVGYPVQIDDGLLYLVVEGTTIGTGTITATAEGGGGSATFFVNVVDIAIKHNGEPVGLGVREVWIGERINLSVTADEAATASWTVPGLIFEDYKTEGGKGEVIDEKPEDLLKKEVGFHWIDGADARIVKVVVTLKADGKPDKVTQRKGTFDVQVPKSGPDTPITIDTEFGTAQLLEQPVLDDENGQPVTGVSEVWLRLVGPPDPDDGMPTDGILFSHSPSFDGTFTWVQTLNGLIHGRNASTQQPEGDYRQGLDRRYPFSDKRTDGDSPGVFVYKKPGQYWFPGTTADPHQWNYYDYVSMNVTFRTVLMFDPGSPGSKPVPLQEIIWTFWAEATWTGPDYDDWISVDLSISPVVGTTTEHPEWQNIEQ